nr:hypothetical protein [Skermanella stibiiresistens]
MRFRLFQAAILDRHRLDMDVMSQQDVERGIGHDEGFADQVLDWAGQDDPEIEVAIGMMIAPRATAEEDDSLEPDTIHVIHPLPERLDREDFQRAETQVDVAGHD